MNPNLIHLIQTYWIPSCLNSIDLNPIRWSLNLPHPTAARASHAIRHGSGPAVGSFLKAIVPKSAIRLVALVDLMVKSWRWQHDPLS